MTRPRAASTGAGTAAEPVGGVSTVRRPYALDDCPDPAARAILECGRSLAYGLPEELAAGRVLVTWRGGVLRVYDGAGMLRAVCASWHGASVAAVVTLAEVETATDLSEA